MPEANPDDLRQFNQAAQREMPRYQCHKVVHALKIESIDTHSGRLVPADSGFAAFEVERGMFSRYVPTAGDYFVVYDDGYQSFSPAKAFEAGYTRL